VVAYIEHAPPPLWATLFLLAAFIFRHGR
jgi:hypothetical protein